ncbi:MAG TPA: hypothetical protein VK157_07070 [Phycisphaerales bacterium]|nr:hypothetical protein [Phycisphaerales bacterium]
MTTIPANVAAAHDVALIGEPAAVCWGRSYWGPILMGATCAIAIQFIFTVLGIAIGATIGEETRGIDGNLVRTMGLSAGLWWLITGTISLALGAIVLARVSGLPRSAALKLQAASMWGVVAIFGFLVVWSGAGMLSQAATPIGTLISTSLDPYANRSGSMTDAMRDMGSASQGTSTPFSDTSLADTTTDAMTISREDARRATQSAAWWSVIGMILGLVATVSAANAAVPMRNRAAVRSL